MILVCSCQHIQLTPRTNCILHIADTIEDSACICNFPKIDDKGDGYTTVVLPLIDCNNHRTMSPTNVELAENEIDLLFEELENCRND